MTDLENDNYVHPGKRYTRGGYHVGNGMGISLRDHIAIEVLAAWVSTANGEEYMNPQTYSDISYDFADAMLLRRNQTQGT
jgi:hypothetical protein